MDTIEREEILGAIHRTKAACRAANDGAANWGFCISGGDFEGDPVLFLTTESGERVVLTRQMVEDAYGRCLAVAGTVPCSLHSLLNDMPDAPATYLRIVLSVAPRFSSAIDYAVLETCITPDSAWDARIIITAATPIPGWPQ